MSGAEELPATVARIMELRADLDPDLESAACRKIDHWSYLTGLEAEMLEARFRTFRAELLAQMPGLAGLLEDDDAEE